MVRVKICGITDWSDAKLAIDAGADALGFNFYPRSPRYIAPAQARRIVNRLPKHVEAVGVVVNESVAAAEAIARAARTGLIQLHGDESPEEVAELARFRRVLKAFRVRPGFRVSALARYGRAAGFLLDGFRSGVRGGTGRRFDWRVAQRAKRYGRIFLAGGLTPANVAEAILAVQPFAIDVCSGVEAEPGKKDPARLRELMRRVEAANRELT